MNPSKRCFAHRHMSIAEYGLWTHLRELSYRSNPQYTYEFSDRKIAERFAPGRGSSKDAVNDLRQSLARKGFIVWLKPKKRASGRFPSQVGRILSHEEWAKSHPGKCFDSPVSPVGNTTFHQSGLEPHQSGLEPSPVGFVTSHQSRQPDIILINTNPSQQEAAAAENLKSTTSDSANHKAHTDACSDSSTGDDLPVSATRQVDCAVSDIASALGIHNEAAMSGWRKIVARFADGGHSPRLVSEVLGFYVREFGVAHVRAEGADNFAVSFPWLLRDMRAKDRIEELA